MSDNNETQEIGAIDFQDANLLFNLLFKQNDHLDESQVIGIALYRLKGTDKGRVIFSGTQLDERKWEKVAVNSTFLLQDGESTHTVEVARPEKKFIKVYFS